MNLLGTISELAVILHRPKEEQVLVFAGFGSGEDRCVSACNFVPLSRAARYRAKSRPSRTHDVDHRGIRAQRLAGRSGHVGEAGHVLRDLVERGAMLVGAGEKSLQHALDQPRVERMRLLPAEAKPVHRAGAEILDQHVGGARKSLATARPSGDFRSMRMPRLLRLK